MPSGTPIPTPIAVEESDEALGHELGVVLAGDSSDASGVFAVVFEGVVVTTQPGWWLVRGSASKRD